MATQIPPEWYQHDTTALSRLIERLYKRRLSVHQLINKFRLSTSNPVSELEEVTKSKVGCRGVDFGQWTTLNFIYAPLPPLRAMGNNFSVTVVLDEFHWPETLMAYTASVARG